METWTIGVEMTDMNSSRMDASVADIAEYGIRCLAPTENWFVAIGAYIGYAVQVRGQVDLRILSAAFDAVRNAYPILSTRLETVGRTHMLARGVPPLPTPTVCDAENLDDLFFDVNVDPRRAMAGIHVVRVGNRSTITLMVHHAIADAHHALAILDELWSAYADLARGVTPDLSPHAYPDAVEKILSDRGLGKFEYPTPPASTPPRRDFASEAGLPVFANSIIRCKLDAERTSALIELCHREKITMNALVSAAIIRSEADDRHVSIANVPYFITVDMRTRLAPPLTPTAATNVLSWIGFTATPHTDIDFVGLSRAIGAHLPAELADGTAVHETARQVDDFFANLMTPTTPGAVVTTNWGVVPMLHSPHGLEIEDFRAGIYNKIQDVSVLTPTDSEALSVYIIYTFENQLSVDIVITDPKQLDSARNRGDAINACLCSISD
ncbi:phthiocerol/phthiodiolone dimycocerosyl transferase family protein [Actinocrispum wychmicini]|uniref:Phthiocerol/phthiodiolone dimycocerosyl transferase n=1 Tax=Actinocrispum wychmicini TaxID=1213861 RepID=A0A4R2IL77_9PSEU|nr:hypothetical protein [Actinocrispum wychmicini]TCO45881.1 acetyltransferase [Actinocrispum wychmicini]